MSSAPTYEHATRYGSCRTALLLLFSPAYASALHMYHCKVAWRKEPIEFDANVSWRTKIPTSDKVENYTYRKHLLLIWMFKHRMYIWMSFSSSIPLYSAAYYLLGTQFVHASAWLRFRIGFSSFVRKSHNARHSFLLAENVHIHLFLREIEPECVPFALFVYANWMICLD